MHGYCVISDGSGVYQNGSVSEGEFLINKSAVMMFNVLFDTGALQRSYISKELVDAHWSRWKSAIKHSPSVVILAY